MAPRDPSLAPPPGAAPSQVLKVPPRAGGGAATRRDRGVPRGLRAAGRRSRTAQTLGWPRGVGQPWLRGGGLQPSQKSQGSSIPRRASCGHGSPETCQVLEIFSTKSAPAAGLMEPSTELRGLAANSEHGRQTRALSEHRATQPECQHVRVPQAAEPSLTQGLKSPRPALLRRTPSACCRVSYGCSAWRLGAGRFYPAPG